MTGRALGGAARAAMAAAVAAVVALGGAAHPAFAAPLPIPESPLGTRGGVTPIAAINANNTAGQSDLEFTIVTVEGVVQQGAGTLDPFDRPTVSTFFTLADGTGSLAIAHPGVLVSPLPQPGQRLRVSSVVFTQGAAPLRGTRTLDFEVFGFGSITNLGAGPVDAPAAVTAVQLQSSGSAFEGARVRVEGLTLVDPGEWPAAGTSGFVRATDGVAEIRFFVDEETNLDGANPPAASFSLIGLVAQDAVDFALEGEHFVYPASLADLVAGDGSGLLTVDPDQVLQSSTGNSHRFTLTGQEAVLAILEIEIPAAWTWTSPVDYSLSGPGFASASVEVEFPGGVPLVRVVNAEVTASATGTITIGSLDAPAVTGSYAFAARTAASGGVPAPLTASPVVRVLTDADAGDVVVNEVYPTTSALAAGREESEFIELHNRTGEPLDISGWPIADIGRTPNCAEDFPWTFPSGAVIPAGGYLVVCRTALDPQGPGPDDDRGFLVDFPEFASTGAPLYEMFDAAISGGSDVDHGATPNLIPRVPTPGDDQIALLGGFVTNTGQCESPYVPGRRVPFAELVVLRDLSQAAIDVFEYREIGPCTADLCASGITGPDDAYAFGAPKAGHSLGRDAASTDTDSGRADIRSSSTPTPGAANVPGDTVPPNLANPTAALSATIVEVTFDEPVQDETAIDPASFRLVHANGDVFACRTVFGDPELPNRHYFLVTDPLPPGQALSLEVSGVRDLVGENGGNVFSGTAGVTVPALASTICAVQEFDERGFSPAVGDTVLVAGFVTIGNLAEVASGAPPPTDRISIWVEEPQGCGVNVFAFLPDGGAEYESFYPSVREFGIRRNDFVVVRGRVTEFVSSTSGAGAVTEIEAIAEDPQFYRFLLRGLPGPTPRTVTTAEASDETLEGSLVTTEGVVISGDERALFVDDGSGAIQVFSNFSAELDFTPFTIGDELRVTGVITQFDSTEPFFSGYELIPQSQESIERLGAGFASGGPAVEVERRVLVPDLGESIRIVTRPPQRSDAVVEIFDVTGEKVITLYDGVGLGSATYEWNGVGDRGDRVKPGVYICHIRTVALDGGGVESATAPIVVGTRLEGSGVAR